MKKKDREKVEENNKGIKSDDDGITEIGEEKNKWRSRKTLEDERKKKKKMKQK